MSTHSFPGGVGAATNSPTAAAPAADTGAGEQRWQERPALAGAVRVVAVLVPVAASVAAAWVVGSMLPTPHGTGHLLWWATVVTASLAALLIVDRAARRLLPLAALLQLSLVFPDRVPSRLGVALRSGSPSRLRQRELDALERGDLEPAEAAHTILALAASLGTHDRDTRGHSERVRAYADLIGAEMKLDDADRDRLRWAALLHDLGKLSVPTTTLHGHDALTDEDWDALRRHPLEGARLAAPLREWLGPWALAIEQHHEKYDGTGYPFGLAGEELSLGARIVAVADSYDAMISVRSYNQAISPAAARAELAAKAGTHFDPVVVRAFLSVALGRVRRVMGPFALFAALPFIPAFGTIRRALETAGRTATLGTVSLAATVAAVQPLEVVDPPPAPPVEVAVPVRRTPPVTLPAPTTTTTTVPEPEPAAEPAPPPPPPPTTEPPRPVPPTTSTTTTTPPATVPATTSTTTTTAPPAPAATIECRDVQSTNSSRPCQPPRWGHTETGNPAPETRVI